MKVFKLLEASNARLAKTKGFGRTFVHQNLEFVAVTQYCYTNNSLFNLKI